MTQSFSLDLRVRVAAFVEAGHSCRAAARHFWVSDSCAIKLMQRKRQMGSLAPARQGRPPGGGKLVPCEAFLIQTAEAEPAITMPELAARLLDEHGIVAAPAMLSRFLCRRGFTYNLWTGRALQEGCFWLDERRFASIYAASVWSSCSGPSWESARTGPA
jgi:transposase